MVDDNIRSGSPLARDACTVAELVQAQWGDHRIALKCPEMALTHHQVAGAAAARAALLGELLPRGAEPHIGVLLDNVPEFPLRLGAEALAGVAVAGINPTRRGPELLRDIAHTDCAADHGADPGPAAGRPRPAAPARARTDHRRPRLPGAARPVRGRAAGGRRRRRARRAPARRRPSGPAPCRYRRFTAGDRSALLARYREHDREHLLER